MNKQQVISIALIVVLFVVIIVLGIIIVRNNSSDAGTVTSTTSPSTSSSTSPSPTPTVSPSTSPSPTPTPSAGSGSTDFSKFSQSKQSAGIAVSGSATTKITSATNADKSDYRRFVFGVAYSGSTPTGSKLPLVEAEYRSDLSSIRLNFKGIMQDSSSIGYLDSVDISTKGITRITHAVTGVADTSTYDIGVVKAADFLLTSKEISTGVWEVTLDVKYPGVVVSSGTIDLGSKVFAQTKQIMAGGKTADGARSTSYSYNSEGGVFQLAFEVQGSAAKPIPDAYVEYVGGKLVMTFTDITDIFGNGKVVNFPSVGAMRVERTGNMSKYYFDGVSGKDFKLYGLQSPNQVVLEIKL